MDVTSNISQAIDALKRGGLLVFPTDTVWGLGLAVEHAASPQAIFEAKQRSAGKPVAWLVGGADALDVYGRAVPDYARNLAHAFWPGALTLVVPASDAVPVAYQSSTGTIALRMPAHTSTLEIVQHAGPLATSSANLSGEVAPARLDEVAPAILEAVACVFDDDSTPSGTASTVIDCTGPTPLVLRQGGVRVTITGVTGPSQ